MMILNSEKLPAGRGELLTIQSHGGMLMSHRPKGGEISLKPLKMDEIRQLRERPPKPRIKRRPSAIGRAIRKQIDAGRN